MGATFLEAGTSATFGTEFWASSLLPGNISSDSVVIHTGPRSLKMTTGSPADWAVLYSPNGVASNAGGRVSVYVYFPSATFAATDNLLGIATSGGALDNITFQVNNTGHIGILPRGASTTFGSTVLSAGVWIRLSFAWTWTSTTINEFRLWINGRQEVTLSNVTTSTMAMSVLYLQAGKGFGTNFLTYFSDIYVDNSTALTDPGDIRVTAKLPAANNTNNFDTAVGANPANRWTNVNERALSATNGWQHAAATDVQENYTLQSAVVGDADLSRAALVSRCAWIWAKGAVGGAGTPKLMDNGTETAIVLTAAGKLFTVLTDSAVYPSNAAGIGMRSTNNADDTFLYECGTLIAYIPRYELAEAAAVADVMSRQAVLGRQSLDAVLTSDVVSRVGAAVVLRALLDAVLAVEAQSRTVRFTRSMVESFSTAELLGQQSFFLRRLAEQVLSADAAQAARTLLRAIQDTVGVQETGPARTTAVARSLAETLSALDALTRTLRMVRTEAEALGLADTLLATSRFARLLAEALALFELPPAAASSMFRAVSDLLGMVDARAGFVLRMRELAEPLGLPETVTGRTAEVARFLADVVALIERLDARTTRLRELTEQVGLAGTLSAAETVMRLLTAQAIVLAEGSSAAAVFARRVAETLPQADALSASVIAAAILRLLSETLPIVDGTSRSTQAWRTAEDALAFAELAQRRTDLLRAVSEAVAAADAVGRLVTVLRSVPETTGFADAIARVAVLVRAVPDGVLLGETAVVAARYLRQVLEAALLVAAESGASVAVVHQLSETLALLDALLRTTWGTRERADAAGMAETWTATVTRPGQVVSLPFVARAALVERFAVTMSIGAGLFQELSGMQSWFSPVPSVGAGLFQERTHLTAWLGPVLSAIRE